MKASANDGLRAVIHLTMFYFWILKNENTDGIKVQQVEYKSLKLDRNGRKSKKIQDILC